MTTVPRTDNLDAPEDANVKVKFWELKRKFRTRTKALYPQVNYPEMVWLFDQLDIDPRFVVQEPITKKHYWAFVPENPEDLNNTRRLVNPNTGETYKVKRSFNSAQRKIVKQWYPLLPQEMVN